MGRQEALKVHEVQQQLLAAKSVADAVAALAVCSGMLSTGDLHTQRIPFATFLLKHALINWLPALTNEQREQHFDVFFVQVPLPIALASIAGHLVFLSTNHDAQRTMQTTALCDLICRTVARPDRLRSAFATEAVEHHITTPWEDALTQLVSIPARAANAACGLADVPTQLHPAPFFELIATECILALPQATDPVIAASSCASMLSRVALTGHAAAVLAALGSRSLPAAQVPLITMEMSMPAITMMVRAQLAHPRLTQPMLDRLLGSEPTIALEHLLTVKLITSIELSRRSLQALHHYLAALSPSRLPASILAAATTFAEPEALTSFPPALLKQLRRWLCWGLRAVGQKELGPGSPVLAAVIRGIPQHLSSPIHEIRSVGMRVAVAMSHVLSPDELLQFDELSDSSQDSSPEDEDEENEPAAAEDFTAETLVSLVPAALPSSQAAASVWGSAWADESDESSDEMETPAPVSDDSSDLDCAAYPKSLSAAILQLRKEEVAAFEGALTAVPELLATAPDTAAVCEELCRALLHVRNSCDLKGFADKRKAGLVALCQRVPSAAARVLTSEFYTQNVAMEVRLLVSN